AAAGARVVGEAVVAGGRERGRDGGRVEVGDLVGAGARVAGGRVRVGHADGGGVRSSAQIDRAAAPRGRRCAVVDGPRTVRVRDGVAVGALGAGQLVLDAQTARRGQGSGRARAAEVELRRTGEILEISAGSARTGGAGDY